MDSVEQIRSVVARHEFPPFVHDLQVRLGEHDGDPVVWLTFSTALPPGMDQRALVQVGETLSRFRHQVLVDLMAHAVGPYPFFRFEDRADAAASH